MKKWLNQNIIALSIVSLFDDFAYEMVIAVLPAFLISIKSSPAAFGLILAISNAFSFLKIIFGRLSDKLHRRKFFTLIGYSLTSLNLLILSIATNWITIFSSWMLSGVGKSIREPSRNALLIESTEPKYYGRVFGFHRTIDSIGSILGPACALFLINYISFSKIFFISFIFSSVTLLIISIYITQTKKHIEIAKLDYNFDLKNLPVKFKQFLIVSVIFSLGNFANSLLIYRTIDLLSATTYDLNFAQKTAILFYTFYNISHTIFSYPAGKLADKFGTKNLLAIGYLLTTIVSFGFMFKINIYTIAILFIMTGIAAAITNSLSKSMIANILEINNHGSGFGLYSTVTGFAFLVANFTVGFLWTKISPFAGFGYSVCFCLIGTILLFNLNLDIEYNQ